MPIPPPERARGPTQGRRYRWTELDGLKALLTFASVHQVTQQELDTRTLSAPESSAPDSPFNRWGVRLSYVQSAFVCLDGWVIVCATTSEWMGTFASHDNIMVRYYGLEPQATA
jgi:hypothetical protein